VSLRLAVLATLASVFVAPAFAASERFEIDSSHTYPSLEMSHMGLSVWRGKFNRTTGHIDLDRAAKTGSVDVAIETASIDFGLDAMNEHALADDWLNPGAHPEIRYQGALVFSGDVPTAVDGELTLLGVRKPVRLAIGAFKCILHPYYKKEVCGADATAEFNRADFGLTKYADADADAGRILVRIQIEAQAPDAAPPAAPAPPTAPAAPAAPTPADRP
jgi:polyisoprenoid-binding protein YceI